jgi:hypothetical protein
MDGIGFGFEKIYAVGARRDQLALEFRGSKASGEKGMAPRVVNLRLDTAAYVAGIPDSQFSSPAELGAVLAKSAQCQECMVKQYFRYTAGRLETAADRPLIRRVSEEFRGSGFQFEELIVSLVTSREFSGGVAAHVASNH